MSHPPRTSRTFRLVPVLLLALLSLLLPSTAHAVSYSDTLIYASPSSAPKPGSLYARAIRLQHSAGANGTMLATFEQYTSGTPVFPIYKSTDAGRSWTQISSISDQHNGWGMRYQPFLYELPVAVGNFPAGTILAAGNSIPSDLSQTQLDLYASTDHGVSWSFVSVIASGGVAQPVNGDTPVWEPFLLAANGKLICYLSDQRDPNYGQKIDHETSTDGVNWSSTVNDVTASPYADRPGMPVVTQLANGSYLMSYEFYGAPEAAFAVYYKIATNPEDFGTATGIALKTTDGIVPTSSPYMTWLPTGGSQGTIVATAGSSSDIFLNTHGGSANTWTHVASNTEAGYSRSLVPLPDGSSVAVFSGGPLSGTQNSVENGAVDLSGDVTSGGVYTLANVNSGQYLTISGGSTTAGAAIVQDPADGTTDQQWRITQQSDGAYKLANVKSGLLLGVSGASLADGASILQWTDNGTLDHEWGVAPAPAGGYTLTNVNSDLYLEMPYATITAGATADQWGPTGCSCQRWTLTKVG